ncbi:oxidoreductase, partial [Bacillus cereus]|nr:oxidoreductase [Bacillus cereus]
NYYKGLRDSILNGEKLPVTEKEVLDDIKQIQ